MTTKWKQIRTMIKLETNISYPTPVLELIVSLPFIFVSYGVLQFIIGISVPSYFVPSFLFWDKLTSTIITLGTKVYAEAIFSMCSIMLFIVPIMVTFNLARELENEITKTILSYPIKRWIYFLTKIFMIIVPIIIAINVGIGISVSVFVPFGFKIENALLMSLAFCVLIFAVAASTSLIAVFTRNLLATAVLGCGIWYGLYFLAILSDYDVVLRGVFNPALMAVSFAGEQVFGFIRDVTMTDFLLSISFSFLLGCAMLIIALIRFNRMEV